MRGVITIDAAPKDLGGIAVEYDGKPVAGDLNVVEAFMMVAGIIKKRGPSVVAVKMGFVSPTLHHHYQTGLAARGWSPMKAGQLERLKKAIAKYNKLARKTAASRSKRG